MDYENANGDRFEGRSALVTPEISFPGQLHVASRRNTDGSLIEQTRRLAMIATAALHPAGMMGATLPVVDLHPPMAMTGKSPRPQLCLAGWPTSNVNID
jgi:hypothetical protein